MFLMGSVKSIFLQARVRFSHSRSSKVINFGVNRKRLCDFLLVLCGLAVTFVTSCTVSEILQVFYTQPLFHSNFRVFPLDQIAHVGVSPIINLNLISRTVREIIFEVFQPMWLRYLNDAHRQTDGQTTYCGITALCDASRGKNFKDAEPDRQDSIAIAKKTARCAQYMGALKSFESPHSAPGYCSRNF